MFLVFPESNAKHHSWTAVMVKIHDIATAILTGLSSGLDSVGPSGTGASLPPVSPV